MSSELYHYIEGGYQKPVSGPTKEKYKSPSYQIKEGKRVNVDITSPGATLALGLIYFGSNNQAIAGWMKAPNTPYLLNQVRPDFLLLRTIAYGLILWDDVMPSSEWVLSNVPETVLKHIDRYEQLSLMEDDNVDYETMYQAYFNLLAGSCYVIALKFAGSCNEEAFEVIHKYFTLFYKWSRNSAVTVIAGRTIAESLMCICVLSLSIVMAGSGDLEVLRIVRMLRERTNSSQASSVGYGSHTALHMALGLLFLGGGRFTLGSDKMCVAALIISCFPKMPHFSGDNRYHLQAFRHLYVMAAEPRLLIPVDVDRNTICRARVSVKFIECADHPSVSYEDYAPMLLPQLNVIEEVTIEGSIDTDRYWPVKFTRGSNLWILEALLKSGVGVAIKLRTGEAPYPALVHSGPGALSSIIPPDKLSAKDTNASLSWVAQNTKLTGIGGDEATELLKILIGVYICDNDEKEECKFLLDDEVEKPSGDAEEKCPPLPYPSDWEDEKPLEVEESQEIREGKMLHQLLTSILYDCLSTGKSEAISSWLIALQVGNLLF